MAHIHTRHVFSDDELYRNCSYLECSGCGATMDAAVLMMVDSSWRGVLGHWDRARTHPESLTLTGDRTQDRQYQRIQAWMAQHRACPVRDPGTTYVTPRGVTVTDRRASR